MMTEKAIELIQKGTDITVTLGCKMYDECLYIAGVNDWNCFNCEYCNYKHQTFLEFIDSVFIPDIGDHDIEIEDDQEIELVDLSVISPFMAKLQETFEYNEHTS